MAVVVDIGGSILLRRQIEACDNDRSIRSGTGMTVNYAVGKKGCP